MPGFDDMIGTPIRDEDELSHFGVPGMRWGRRRYQNPDGSLTPLGREHYGRAYKRKSDAGAKRVERYEQKAANAERFQLISDKYENGTLFRRKNEKKAAKFRTKYLKERWKASNKLARERRRSNALQKRLDKKFKPEDARYIRENWLGSNSLGWR